MNENIAIIIKIMDYVNPLGEREREIYFKLGQ
jgi:hypothetical protein